MSAASCHSWLEENQRHLMAAVARVRGALEGHAALGLKPRTDATAEGNVQTDGGDRTPRVAEPCLGTPPTGAFEPAQAADGLHEHGPAPALEALCEMFQLTPFERDVLLMCAGMELDGRFPALCAAAQGDAQRNYPTFSLALAALSDAHWSALPPAAPLRHWQLIELAPGQTLTLSPIRIDERILHLLTGVVHVDERLAGLLEPIPTAGELVESHRAVAVQLAEAWSRPCLAHGSPVVQLCGDETDGKRAIAVAACGAVGLKLNALSAHLIPANPGELEALARLCEREMLLGGSALMLDCDHWAGTDSTRDASSSVAVARFIERMGGPLIVATRQPRRAAQRRSVSLDVHKPMVAEQRLIWLGALGQAAAGLNGEVDLLVSQFSLGATDIHSACAAVMSGHGSACSIPNSRALWDTCRIQARASLDELAQRIEPAANWDDLVVPPAQRQTLRDIAAQVRQRATVYEKWGFASKGKRGLGISALFAGSSGTGKTMAAEVLANELRLDLYRIDLSQVVNKYIGETEKNLRRVFEAAENSGAILLFDEADALFGKRSEVKDSHDRYANIEVSYLLQRMEAYRGLAILTTNMREALDPAFLRRIRFAVQFPFPDVAHRTEIWRRIFPGQTPTEGLDASQLSRLNVAGGNIRNIALSAAFLAAEAGEPVRMPHLLRAARGEYAKLEKPLTEAETRDWS